MDTGSGYGHHGDERDARIIRRLYSIVGPGPAAMYRDAVELLQASQNIECKPNLIGHLFREIEFYP